MNQSSRAIVFVAILVNFIKFIKCQSPCPELFQYYNDGAENYGLFYWSNAHIGQTYLLDIKLTVRGQLPSSYFGELSLLEGKEATLQNILHNKPIVYKIKFPVRNQLPKVTQISVNNQIVCAGPSDTGSMTKISLQHTLQTQTQLPLGAHQTTTQFQPPTQTSNFPQFQQPNQIPNFPQFGVQTNFITPNDPYLTYATDSGEKPEFTFNPQKPSRPQVQTTVVMRPRPSFTRPQSITRPVVQPPTLPPAQEAAPPPPAPTGVSKDPRTQINQICGRAAPKPLVVGGEVIERGTWPWLVAIYLNDPKSLSFKCGGNLVSSRTVITAAHCFKLQGVEHKPENILVVAGRYNLLNWGEGGSVTTGAERILIHPDYHDDLRNFDGDVAVVLVKQKIEFTQYIRPVCLWAEPTDLRMIEGSEGIVIGWGKDETGKDVSPEPKKVSATIVSDESCLRSNDYFSKITSNRTLCAGRRDGQGPCSGDSGGGLMLMRNKRWVLRGTVSGSLSDAQTNSCDLNEYVIYSDVAKFMSWIYKFMIY